MLAVSLTTLGSAGATAPSEPLPGRGQEAAPCSSAPMKRQREDAATLRDQGIAAVEGGA
jgi:hypothetical protein